MKKEVVVSGIRATGRLHLGNYLGAIKNFFPLQEGHECYFFVADYHTLTTSPDPDHLRTHRLPIVKTFMATGIDPEKSAIFFQSSIPEVTELQVLLGMSTLKAELERCTTFKEQVEKNPKNVNLGLLSYPVLMAADILIHKGTVVPVGHDQLQHIEMTRKFARQFNNRYRKVFPIPHALEHEPIRLPGLNGSKMGKSDDNTIDLLDDSKTVQKKINKVVSDEARTDPSVPGDPKNRCKVIFPLHEAVSGPEKSAEIEAACKAATLRCGDCKAMLCEAMMRTLAPIQEAYHGISDSDVQDALAAGSQKAQVSARKTLAEVRSCMGLD